MSHLQTVPLFVTPPHGCSYLSDRSARMLFVDPKETITSTMISTLSQQGFRRSGGFIYKPNCGHCRQCLSVRIPVAEFKLNKSQKRALKANADLTQRVIASEEATHQHYELYARYINERHRDGDMYPPSLEQFETFLKKTPTRTIFIEYWDKQTLVCVAVCDVLNDGLSAVYTFYDPSMEKRSLGTFSILEQVNFVGFVGKPYLYLGYWVPEAQKMKYKRNFEPLEIFVNEEWQRTTRKLNDTDVGKLLIAINSSAKEHVDSLNLPFKHTE